MMITGDNQSSRVESYISAFGPTNLDADTIDRIEIPLIQRDYAQGRREPKVDAIRDSFLETLHSALTVPVSSPVGLDFIYGDLEDGIFRPLDGQQRLTTLFLLHVYIAGRSGHLDPKAPWAQFSYATRQSARRFCERLITFAPPLELASYSEWITDQSWYLFIWRHDPTIQSMLVMLDDIHRKFASADAELIWQRLSDIENPAIAFHLLPLPDMESEEELYIKMNSRGKPLTDFENFKAHFERIIESSKLSKGIANKLDQDWADTFWQVRGHDNLIDDEVLRYFEFVTEVCEWLDPNGRQSDRLPLVQRAERVFGPENSSRDVHIEFLFRAFDVWTGRDIDEFFANHFRKPLDTIIADDRLPVFFRDTNLFSSCCQSYGVRTGSRRHFTFAQTLMLVAAITHLSLGTDDFDRRCRILRNLIEDSTDEIRAERMPQLLADVQKLMITGELPSPGASFNAVQIADEQLKVAFRDAHPMVASVLDTLEDHPLLRGSVVAFELEPESIEQRTTAFYELMDAPDQWDEALGALLAKGDYFRARGRDLARPRSYQFGTYSPQYRDSWRLLLTGANRTSLQSTSRVLANLLDDIASRENQLSRVLADVQSSWLQEREAKTLFDWRYYMVKYSDMRCGSSGIYFVERDTDGFSMCNLRGGITQMNSLYRDPYLFTIWSRLGRPAEITDPKFFGYEWNPRFMTLAASQVGVRVIPEGFRISIPDGMEANKRLQAILVDYKADENLVISIPRKVIDDSIYDEVDRIDLGQKFFSDLIEAGF